MKLRNILFLLFFFFSSNIFATNIRVIDFQTIIDNNNSLASKYIELEKDQKKYTDEFKKEELSLQDDLKEIEKLKLILDSTELDNEINKYNEKLKNFNYKIEKFNIHYETQIANMKSQIVTILLEILKKYSTDNNIELILDSNNYILSSNSINVTDIILDKLNNQTIELIFEKY